MGTLDKTYVSLSNLETLADYQKKQNKIYSDFLDKQTKINKDITNNIVQLSENQQLLDDKFSSELEKTNHAQDTMIEAYRKINYNFLLFKKGSIINGIVDTVVIAALIMSMMIAHLRINDLEKKVAQYEQDKTIVLEDNSAELVYDRTIS